MSDARCNRETNGHSFGYPLTARTGAENPFVLFGRSAFYLFAKLF